MSNHRDFQLQPPPFSSSLLAATCVLCYFVTSHLESVSLSPGEILPPQFQIYRLFTSQFNHSGFFHILFNLLALMGMGVGLEKHMGSTRFLAMSIILGLVAGILYVAICGTLRSITGDIRWLFYSSVGFSGVLFAYATIETFLPATLPTRKIFGVNIPTKAYPWILMALIQVFIPGASFLGHLTGIFAGLLASNGLLYCLLPTISWVLRAENASQQGILSSLRQVSNFVPCPSDAVDNGISSSIATRLEQFHAWRATATAFSSPSLASHGETNETKIEGATGNEYDWGSQGVRLGDGKSRDVVVEEENEHHVVVTEEALGVVHDVCIVEEEVEDEEKEDTEEAEENTRLLRGVEGV